MTQALEVPDVAKKHQPKYTLEVLNDFPELKNWLKQISRFGKFKDFIFISDYKEKESVRFQIFTREYQYFIKAKLPIPNIKENQNNNYGYLGCISQCRKPRAGEDWTRGRDLADGKYCEETWNEIVNDILALEMVKVIRNSEYINNK